MEKILIQEITLSNTHYEIWGAGEGPLPSLNQTTSSSTEMYFLSVSSNRRVAVTEGTVALSRNVLVCAMVLEEAGRHMGRSP